MEFWILVALFISIIAIVAITPLITRKVEAFGVTVPEGVKQEPFVKKQITTYITLCTALGLVLTVALLLLIQSNQEESFYSIVFSCFVFGYMIASFAFYYVSHLQIKKWKQTQSWYDEQLTSQRIVVQTGFYNKRTTITLVWYLPHLLLVVGTVIYSLLNYEKFPATIPMQYNFAGEVTRSVEKSLSSVLGLSGVALTMIVVFIFSHISISKAKQIVESKDPEGSVERNRIFRYSWSIFLAITGFLVIFIMCLGQLSSLLEISNDIYMLVVFPVIGVIIVGSIVLSIKTGQGGSRIKLKGSNAQSKVAVADQDQFWKAGVFYWNRNDPAIFVEKRFGVGWTMNFARPLSWFIIIGIFAIVLIPTIFLS
ncbi:MAG TPA: DUF1648 domain-containing protein [Candidatus Paenibacillus intestinavium]|nr:DUF1648 domain-containing protein [Candidatus Paenibacillus intestinavium]